VRADEIMLLCRTTSYRLDDFRAAAARRGVGLLVGTDRCSELAAVWPEEAFGSVALDFRDPDAAVDAIVARAPSAIIPTDELTAVLAARASATLGLRGNPPASAQIARDKSRLRAALATAGVACPGPVQVLPIDGDAASFSARVAYPCVLKPLSLSGSRGVIRADNPNAFLEAWGRIARLLARPELEDARAILVEPFVPGAEVAVEGLLVAGQLRTLAIFDKPDPLDGPFFEETIYVTPSRHAPDLQAAVIARVGEAARAMGLLEGPVHAELRLASEGPVVLEVAARSIGGLCARPCASGSARPRSRSSSSTLRSGALTRRPRSRARRAC
jgi:biotin carboxylase